MLKFSVSGINQLNIFLYYYNGPILLTPPNKKNNNKKPKKDFKKYIVIR